MLKDAGECFCLCMCVYAISLTPSTSTTFPTYPPLTMQAENSYWHDLVVTGWVGGG